MNHEEFMLQAISLAKKGVGGVNPNPLVGAVIVKNNKIIGEGYHEKYGGLHAERNALKNCTENPNGATMYVTLEPCCHFGKTPPCTEAIINSGIKKVFVATLDPNPLVAGKGVKILESHQIEVHVGLCEQQCLMQNHVFFHYIKTKTPYVVMKYAMTADGKIATVTGKSKWITSPPARNNVHKDRNRYSAIMVGVATVIADDPMLNCRIENGRNPVRIICDTNLRTPLSAKVVTTAREIPTIIATACTDKSRHTPYINSGVELLELTTKNQQIDLLKLMALLGEKQIDSILLEGGATLNFSALESGIVNKIQCYIAPKIFGGEAAKTPVSGKGILKVENSIKLKNQTILQLGEDILIESEVER